MNISYDQGADVLYVTFEGCENIVGEYVETVEGNVLRIDPSTQRVIGFTIISFAKRLDKNHEISIPEIGALPFAFWSGALKHSHA